MLSHSVCPTLCNPVDCSLPGSSVHGILQARILEWVAMPSCRGSSNPGIEPRSPALKAYILPSKPLGSPGILGWEDPLGSPRILEWVNYPFSRDRPFFLTDPGIELGSPALQADSLPTEPLGKPSAVIVTSNKEDHGKSIFAIREQWFLEERQVFSCSVLIPTIACYLL